jgi:hypothetical protein
MKKIVYTAIAGITTALITNKIVSKLEYKDTQLQPPIIKNQVFVAHTVRINMNNAIIATKTKARKGH